MKKYLFLIFISVLIINASVNSQSVISFKEEVYDFGNINEVDGIASHTFEFTNTGKTPLIINDIKPSCDCTTPTWTKNPVMPGAKGFVKAEYDTKDRGGIFEKEIKVISNAANSPIVIKIKGSVKPKAMLTDQKYTSVFGDIRMTKSYIGFDKIYSDNSKTEKIDIINSGKDNVTFKFENIPSFVKVTPAVVTIPAGKTSQLSITYQADNRKDWGFLVDYLQFSINNKREPKFQLTLSATIIENFEKLTKEQLSNAPIATLLNPTYQFGNVKEGEQITHNFQLTNTGKSDLIIRKIGDHCSCLSLKMSQTTIKPGESSNLNVTFDTKGKKGDNLKAITIITNSPTKTNLKLEMKGVVE